MPEPTTIPVGAKRVVQAHDWELEKDEWYAEPRWVAKRIFEEEQFVGEICDPCCGLGRIPEAAQAAGLEAIAMDLVHRGYPGTIIGNFMESQDRRANFVFNPPFKLGRMFAQHALSLAERKVVMIFPMRRLNAAGAWLQQTPHKHTWYLTPRPSMPPGHVVAEHDRNGTVPSGGKQDFCVLVFERGFNGWPTEGWLHRNPEKQWRRSV